MANRHVSHRMNVILDAVGRSEILATDAGNQLEHCMSALESIDQRHIDLSRELSCRLVTAFLSDGPDDELFPNETVDDVLLDYRAFIASFPD
jgi:hypothetical protein